MRYIAILANLLFVSACDGGGKYDSSALSGLEQKVRTVLAVESEFKEQHINTGVDAKTFVNGLRQQGFVCNAWYVSSVRFSDSAAASTYRFPMVSCVKAPALIEPCLEFTVVIRFVAVGSLDLRSLVRKLPDLNPGDASYICETTRTTDEKRKRIAEAIASGDAVPIQ
jgi:hypothetical protein